MRSLRLLALVAILLFTSSAYAQNDAPDASEQKYKDIRTLLTILNVGPTMRQSMLDQIDEERQVKDSEVPAEFWDQFEKEVLASPQEFVERMIPAYDAQFTHDEIKSLIKIYQDPAMKKYINAQNALGEAAGKAEEAWADELGKRAAARITNASTTAEPASDKASKKKK